MDLHRYRLIRYIHRLCPILRPDKGTALLLYNESNPLLCNVPKASFPIRQEMVYIGNKYDSHPEIHTDHSDHSSSLSAASYESEVCFYLFLHSPSYFHASDILLNMSLCSSVPVHLILTRFQPSYHFLQYVFLLF